MLLRSTHSGSVAVDCCFPQSLAAGSAQAPDELEVLGLVLEEGGSVAVAALHRVLDRLLKAWLVLTWAAKGGLFHKSTKSRRCKYEDDFLICLN